MKRQPLNRATIVAAAIALADEEGMTALTMRKVAARLGFEVMALYNHVANKSDLLASMVDAIIGTIDDLPPDLEPLDQVREHALATRAALVRHPWAADMWMRHLPGPARRNHMEKLLRSLAQSGLSAAAAHLAFHAVDNHVLGYTLQEQTMSISGASDEDTTAIIESFMATVDPELHPHTVTHVQQHLDGETGSSFEVVLDLIIEGVTRL